MRPLFKRIDAWLAEDQHHHGQDRPTDAIAWINVLVYLAAAFEFGVPIWKAVIIAVLVTVASAMNYGRSSFARLGVVLMALTMLRWSGALAPLEQWLTTVAAAIKHCAA